MSCDLGTLGGPNSGGLAVNLSGQIVGFADTPDIIDASPNPVNVMHAFLYSAGVMQDLGALAPGSHSYAEAINDAGDIAGESGVGGPGFGMHAFLYSHGVMQDIGTLPGDTNTIVRGISSSGDVIGYASSMDSVETPHGFIYTNGSMMDLNNLLDPSDPLTPYAVIEQATSINDAGVILAQGQDSRNNWLHSYLLTPSVPPSITTAAPGTCSPGNNPPSSPAPASPSSPSPDGSSGTSTPTGTGGSLTSAVDASSATPTGGGGAMDTFTLLLLGSLIVQALRTAAGRTQAD